MSCGGKDVDGRGGLREGSDLPTSRQTSRFPKLEDSADLKDFAAAILALERFGPGERSSSKKQDTGSRCDVGEHVDEGRRQLKRFLLGLRRDMREHGRDMYADMEAWSRGPSGFAALVGTSRGIIGARLPISYGAAILVVHPGSA